MGVGDGDGKSDGLENRHVLAPVGDVGDALGRDVVALRDSSRTTPTCRRRRASRTGSPRPSMRVRAQRVALRERGTTGIPRWQRRLIDSPSRTLKSCVHPVAGPGPPSLASVSVPSMSTIKRAMSEKATLCMVLAIVITCAAVLGVLGASRSCAPPRSGRIHARRARVAVRRARVRLSRGRRPRALSCRARRAKRARPLEIGRSAVRCHVGEVRPIGGSTPAVRSRSCRPPARATSSTPWCATRPSSARRASSPPRPSAAWCELGQPRRARSALEPHRHEAARQCGRGDAPALVGPLPWSDALLSATDQTMRRSFASGNEPRPPPAPSYSSYPPTDRSS